MVTIISIRLRVSSSGYFIPFPFTTRWRQRGNRGKKDRDVSRFPHSPSRCHTNETQRLSRLKGDDTVASINERRTSRMSRVLRLSTMITLQCRDARLNFIRVQRAVSRVFALAVYFLTKWAVKKKSECKSQPRIIIKLGRKREQERERN